MADCRREEGVMKHLFLTSQFYHVADSIQSKLDIAPSTPIVFINTCLTDKDRKASELDWHYRNIESLKRIGFDVQIYDITGKSEMQVRRDLTQFKYMYVEGGNSFYLLEKSQKSNFGKIIKEQINSGMVYFSTSAGSLITGMDISACSRPGKIPDNHYLKDLSGFQIVNFNIHPHWGDPTKRDNYLNFKIPQSYKEDFPYIFLTDKQYIEVIDDSFQIINTNKE